MKKSVSPSLTTSFNYKGNNMDIADIRRLKRDAEIEISNILSGFMTKTGVDVRGFKCDRLETTSISDCRRTYSAGRCELDVRV